jgi:hypothetical protein
MTTTKLVLIGIAVFGLIFVFSLFLYGVSVNNKEVRLRNTITAKQKDNNSEYDNMWKKISQVAQVTDAQKDALKEILVSHAKARSGDDSKNLIMKWVQESIPNVDQSTYKTLMNVITSSRDSFTMRQKELLDLKREHDNLLDTFPSGTFLAMFGKQKIEVVIITSSRTEEAFKTGKDDDVNVFQKKGPAEK